MFGGDGGLRPPRPWIERTLLQAAAISSEVLLLPFPSYPCAAKPLSGRLEWGSDVYCFLALLALNKTQSEKPKHAFLQQGLALWIACRESFRLPLSFTCSSELSWVSKQLCFGEVYTVDHWGANCTVCSTDERRAETSVTPG